MVHSTKQSGEPVYKTRYPLSKIPNRGQLQQHSELLIKCTLKPYRRFEVSSFHSSVTAPFVTASTTPAHDSSLWAMSLLVRLVLPAVRRPLVHLALDLALAEQRPLPEGAVLILAARVPGRLPRVLPPGRAHAEQRPLPEGALVPLPPARLRPPDRLPPPVAVGVPPLPEGAVPLLPARVPGGLPPVAVGGGEKVLVLPGACLLVASYSTLV